MFSGNQYVVQAAASRKESKVVPLLSVAGAHIVLNDCMIPGSFLQLEAQTYHSFHRLTSQSLLNSHRLQWREDLKFSVLQALLIKALPKRLKKNASSSLERMCAFLYSSVIFANSCQKYQENLILYLSEQFFTDFLRILHKVIDSNFIGSDFFHRQ